MATGDRARGLEILRRSVSSDPANPNRYQGLGVALTAVGRLDEALATFRKGLALGDPNGHISVGLVLLFKGEPAAAMEEFNLVEEEDDRLGGRALALDALNRKAESKG